MHERLEAEDSEAAGNAHGAGQGGCVNKVGPSWTTGNGFGEILEVFVEELYAGEVMGFGLVKLGFQRMDPGASQREGGDACFWSHDR